MLKASSVFSRSVLRLLVIRIGWLQYHQHHIVVILSDLLQQLTIPGCHSFLHGSEVGDQLDVRHPLAAGGVSLIDELLQFDPQGILRTDDRLPIVVPRRHRHGYQGIHIAVFVGDIELRGKVSDNLVELLLLIGLWREQQATK